MSRKATRAYPVLTGRAQRADPAAVDKEIKSLCYSIGQALAREVFETEQRGK